MRTDTPPDFLSPLGKVVRREGVDELCKYRLALLEILRPSAIRDMAANDFPESRGLLSWEWPSGHG